MLFMCCCYAQSPHRFSDRDLYIRFLGGGISHCNISHLRVDDGVFTEDPETLTEEELLEGERHELISVRHRDAPAMPIIEAHAEDTTGEDPPLTQEARDFGYIGEEGDKDADNAEDYDLDRICLGQMGENIADGDFHIEDDEHWEDEDVGYAEL